MILTIEHILNLVDALPTNVNFDYVSGGKSKAKLISVDKERFRVDIVRVNADGTEKNASMTTDILNTLVAHIRENEPFKFDNVLNGSGNVRSTMEAIFAHTTEFYFCKIGRVKHLIWVPRIPHEIGKIVDYNTIKTNVEEYLKDETTIIDRKYIKHITAIKSKPFLLLAGISGTGKSRIVRELARACWVEGSEEYKNPRGKNFEMVQVKPNWHDSSELIGYVSRVSGSPVFVAGDFMNFVSKAWENPEVPYFLCLDEMNLAPVEQYFAEYLSVVESRKSQEDGTITTDPILKKSQEDWYRVLTSELTNDEGIRTRFLNDGICIPQNLIVVGTVNMDETTFSFSRKVLDRAMTIEMNEVDLLSGLDSQYEKIGKLEAGNLIGTAVEGVDIYQANKDVCDTALKYLEAVNTELEGTPFKVAYRTRNEFLLYVVNNLPYNKDQDGKEMEQNFVIARALDEITSMKILSRIEGDSDKIGNLLNNLQNVIKEQLKAISNREYSDKKDDGEKEYSVSLAKLAEMEKRLKSGYTSFWS